MWLVLFFIHIKKQQKPWINSKCSICVCVQVSVYVWACMCACACVCAGVCVSVQVYVCRGACMCACVCLCVLGKHSTSEPHPHPILHRLDTSFFFSIILFCHFCTQGSKMSTLNLNGSLLVSQAFPEVLKLSSSHCVSLYCSVKYVVMIFLIRLWTSGLN